MGKKFNTVGGGAATNRNGLEFERGTDLREAISAHAVYGMLGDDVIIKESLITVGRLFEKHKLYKNLLTPNGIDYRNVLSKKLLPDDAMLVADTLYIIEKKFQQGSGSVDEKLQTAHFKLKQYRKLLQPLGYQVRFYYLLNDWFRKPEYRDVLDYIKEVECAYFFEKIPLEALGL